MGDEVVVGKAALVKLVNAAELSQAFVKAWGENHPKGDEPNGTATQALRLLKYAIAEVKATMMEV
jgi:hypothetical protein